MRIEKLQISFYWTALVAGALLALLSCAGNEHPQAAAQSAATAAPVVVPVAHVTRGNIASTTVLTAEFQPFQEVDVMAKVAGYVRTIQVDLGSHVREGQALAELEVPEMTDDISRAGAVIEQAGAEIQAARDELKRVQESHDIAHISYKRLDEVSKREAGLIPRQELDESRSRDLVAEALMTSVASKLRVEQQKIRVARADETRLRTMRNYVKITAPFSGIVTKRYANVGAMIQAGTSSQSQAMPVVRLSQTGTLRLSLPVPESLAGNVRASQKVEVRVKSLGKTMEGRVARFAGKVDPATRTMVTEVDVNNLAGTIMPGMYAEVAMQLQKHEGVLTVPAGAVERAGSTARVYVVDSSGAIRVTTVELGIEDSARVEVMKGLQENDMVITGRRAGLKAGDVVRTRIESTQ